MEESVGKDLRRSHFGIGSAHVEWKSGYSEEFLPPKIEEGAISASSTGKELKAGVLIA